MMEVSHGTLDRRTKLKVAAPVFQPAPGPEDVRMDTIVSCLHLALASCGQISGLKIERGLTGPMVHMVPHTVPGRSSFLVSADLLNGSHAASRCYDVMQLTKQALDGITTRLPATSLLSARVQKEDCGYSLRSSVACLPSHAQDCTCWDIIRKGSCPRRDQCRWYHPQDSDIARIKVSIKYTEDTSDGADEEQLDLIAASRHALASRHKISLGELVR